MLISANREEINMITLPLGLASVAAALDAAGHRVEMIDLMTVPDWRSRVDQKIQDLDPQLIGVSVRNIDDQNMNSPRLLLDQAGEVVAFCRDRFNGTIVLGGAGFSIFPEAVLEYLKADMGIQGEGERALPELTNRLERKEDLLGVPGLYLPETGSVGPRCFIDNLDDLPWENITSWLEKGDQDREIWLPAQTRRGCPLGCSYCSTASVEGRVIRKRSPQKAAAIIAGQAEAGFQRVFFTDNTFNLPRSHALAFCRELAQYDQFPVWRCIYYPGKPDPELISAMARAGCIEASLGFESGAPKVLKAMGKHFTPDEIKRTSALLAENGIRQTGFLMLGGPGETRETVEQSLSLVDDLKLNLLKITVGIRIYPHTSLARTAAESGLISRDDSLITPNFYLEPKLADWLPQRAREWAAGRSNVLPF